MCFERKYLKLTIFPKIITTFAPDFSKITGYQQEFIVFLSSEKTYFGYI